MSSKDPVLGETTKITIWLLIPILGGMIWLNDMHSRITASAAEISNLKNQQYVSQEYLIAEIRTIRKRLDEISDSMRKR